MDNTFYIRLKRICDQMGTTVTAVSKAAKCASGSPTAWKNGAEPKFETIKKIADYLNVSVFDLSPDLDDVSKTDLNISDSAIKFALFGTDEMLRYYQDVDLSDL